MPAAAFPFPARFSRPLLMGILNVTPDSFSDGGRFLDPRQAVEHGLRLAAEGADLLDLGAESTRPGAKPVSAREQLRRLLPVVEALRRAGTVPLSIDTRSALVARACLESGAALINDISALRHDPRMAPLAAQWRCGVVLLHMRGTPRTMQRNPRYRDVLHSIAEFFRQRLRCCERAGIERNRIWLDPGIGFGKTLEHNLEILAHLGELSILDQPLLVGVSRKRFLGLVGGEKDPSRRTAASLAAGLFALSRGASILRVHDVAEHRQAIRTWQALANLDKPRKSRTPRDPRVPRSGEGRE